MKKLFVLISAALFVCSFSANAQFYAGGSLGFTSSSLSVEGSDGSYSGASIRVTPEVGYQLSDNLSVGVLFGYANGLAAFGSISPNEAYKTIVNIGSAALNIVKDPVDYKANILFFNPYVRYNLIESGDFTFGIEAGASYGLADVVLKADDPADPDTDIKLSLIEIAAKPVITYAISDNIRLISRLGAAGYQSIGAKAGAKGEDLKKFGTVSNLGVAASSYNLTFGVEFKF